MEEEYGEGFEDTEVRNRFIRKVRVGGVRGGGGGGVRGGGGPWEGGGKGMGV